jgi:hypothetical protein
LSAAAGFGHEIGLVDPQRIVVVLDAGAGVEEGAGGHDLVVHAPLDIAAEGGGRAEALASALLEARL